MSLCFHSRFARCAKGSNEATITAIADKVVLSLRESALNGSEITLFRLNTSESPLSDVLQEAHISLARLI